MITYTFKRKDDRDGTFTTLTTTPRTVRLFNEGFSAYLADEANKEATTMEMLFALLPLAAKGTDGTVFEDLEYDDFDVKEAERLIGDFLPSGTAILRTLAGY